MFIYLAFFALGMLSGAVLAGVLSTLVVSGRNRDGTR